MAPLFLTMYLFNLGYQQNVSQNSLKTEIPIDKKSSREHSETYLNQGARPGLCIPTLGNACITMNDQLEKIPVLINTIIYFSILSLSQVFTAEILIQPNSGPSINYPKISFHFQKTILNGIVQVASGKTSRWQIATKKWHRYGTDNQPEKKTQRIYH